jgi:RHS repeat-associated protein
VRSDGVKEYAYDARGNRTSDGKTYYYDPLDRLSKVVLEDNSYITYSYDAFDRRLEKTTYSSDNTQLSHVRYLYALENEIGAVDDRGTITELRILGEGLGAEIGTSVALELQGKLYVPLHDTRGNVVALLDESGAVVESYRYDAFGNETIYDARGTSCKKSLVNNPWRFSSKRVDDETGLVYFGRRYYDPALGKWLTMDPLGLKAGPNLYAYVLNNPMTHFDLYGLIEESELNRDAASNESFFSGIWEKVSSWGDYISSCSKEAIRETIKEELRGDICFDMVEYAASQSNSQNTFNIDHFLHPSPLNPPYQFDKDLDGSEALSVAIENWITNVLINKGFARTQVKTSVKLHNKANLTKVNSRRRLAPHPDATGPHSSFKKDPLTGETTKYETYAFNTNPNNPNKWNMKKAYHGKGDDKGHFNKVLDKRIPHPHVHEETTLGGVRNALPDEIPKKPYNH